MSATQIDIDDEALSSAMRLAGVTTKKAMVNLALREYTQRRQRSAARLRHFARAQGWDSAGFWAEHEVDRRRYHDADDATATDHIADSMVADPMTTGDGA